MQRTMEIICFFFVLYLQKKALIRFTYDNFLILDESKITQWLSDIAMEEGYTISAMDFNFVDAAQLLSLNQEFLKHDTDTDIITFDYTTGNTVSAEAFISLEAVAENAKKYSQTIENEQLRLICHALLHCLGYNDKSAEEKKHIRSKEDECINLFHVKQPYV